MTATVEAPAPDTFLRTFVERRGGLAETDAEGRLELALPAALARALELPELAPAVEARLGAAVLERAVAEARRGTTVAAVSLEGARLKTEGVGALVEGRLAAGNARLRAGDVGRSRGAALLVALRYEAVSDEARGGVIEVALDMADLTRVPDPRGRLRELEVRSVRPAPIAPEAAHRLASAISRHALPLIERHAAPFFEAMLRRQSRDQGRVRGYYDHLLRELKDPRCARFRKLSPEESLRRRTEERKTIELECARRLDDAARQYAVRFDVSVAAALRIEHEEVAVKLEVRRRTKERTLRAAWSPLLRDVKPLLCEHCGEETRTFDVCDDALHVLCAACTSKRCPACRAPR